MPVAPGTRPSGTQPVQIGHPNLELAAITADINRADKQTRASDHACTNGNRGPTRVTTPPSQELLSQLGVLRRPNIPSPTLNTLLAGGFLAGSRVEVNYIRLARIIDGRAYYLIPEGDPSGLSPIPPRCFREIRDRLTHIDRNLPKSERAEALRMLADGFRATRSRTARPGLCFAVVTTRHVKPPNGVNSGCSTTTAFLSPGLDGGIGLGDRSGGQIFAAIVPDRVASVTLRFSANATDPARTLTSRAVNNVVVFKSPDAPPTQTSPQASSDARQPATSSAQQTDPDVAQTVPPIDNRQRARIYSERGISPRPGKSVL